MKYCYAQILSNTYSDHATRSVNDKICFSRPDNAWWARSFRVWPRFNRFEEKSSVYISNAIERFFKSLKQFPLYQPLVIYYRTHSDRANLEVLDSVCDVSCYMQDALRVLRWLSVACLHRNILSVIRSISRVTSTSFIKLASFIHWYFTVLPRAWL